MPTPWQSPCDLARVANDLVRTSKDLRANSTEHQPWFPATASEGDLARMEQKLGVKLPADLRKLYEIARPEHDYDAYNCDPIIYPLGHIQYIPSARQVLIDEFGTTALEPPFSEEQRLVVAHFILHHRNLHLICTIFEEALDGSIAPGWLDTPYFVFGQTSTGDCLFYCPLPPGHPIGTIAFNANHQDPPIVIVGHSLAQWLSRYVACGCREFALYDTFKWSIDAGMEALFIRDHLRLNPHAEWMQRRQQGDCYLCGYQMNRSGPTCPECGATNESYA